MGEFSCSRQQLTPVKEEALIGSLDHFSLSKVHLFNQNTQQVREIRREACRERPQSIVQVHQAIVQKSAQGRLGQEA